MLEIDRHIKSWSKRVDKSSYSRSEIAKKIRMNERYFNKMLALKPHENITRKTYKKIELILQKLGL